MVESGFKMRRAKTIEELYEEVISNGCDFVVTTDVSLATALSRRVDVPHFGDFAMTPMNIAYKSAESNGVHINTDIEVVRVVSDETGLDMRYVHGEIENIREIRRHTQDVEANISHSRSSKKVLTSYSGLMTIERYMGEFEDRG